MNYKIISVIVMVWCFSATGKAQYPPFSVDPTQVKTSWVPLPGADGVLYEPVASNPKKAIAILNTHPNGTFNLATPFGPELSRRGYRVLELNHYGDPIGFEGIAPTIARGIKVAVEP
jgi:hypothetical protein